MAIALDATANGITSGGTKPNLSYNHTVTGSNTILFVNAATDGLMSTVTYNSVSMTKIGTETADGIQVTLWYLIAPTTGTNAVLLTPTANSNIVGQSVSYTGASQTGQPDNSGLGAPTTTTSYSQSLSSVADNCWAVWGAIAQSTQALTEVAPTTRRKYDTSFFGAYLADNNAAITPAGNVTFNVTSNSQKFYSIMATFAPAAAAASGPRKLALMGVG